MWKYGAACAVLLGAAGWFLVGPQECTKHSLYETFQDEVKSNLRSPASAVFPPVNEAIRLNVIENCFLAFGTYVDSQNGFGAMIRTKVEGNAKVENGIHTSTAILWD